MSGRWGLLTIGLLSVLFWLFYKVTDMATPEPSNSLEFRTDIFQVPRGYGYGPPGLTPYFPLLDPTVFLAGLAFLAFLIQTIHSIFATYHAPAQNQSLVGGLVDSLVPTKTRHIDSYKNKYEDVIRAIEIYELLNKEKKKEPLRWGNAQLEPLNSDSKPSSTVLVPVNLRSR